MSPLPLKSGDEVISVVRRRLSEVDTSLAPQTQIRLAYQAGQSVEPVDTSQFLTSSIAYARSKPIEAASFGLGVLDSVSTPEHAACAALVLSAALIWWGYHSEAYSILSAFQVEQRDEANLCEIYRDWHLVLCCWRLGLGAQHSLDQLAKQLADIGDRHGSACCQLDWLTIHPVAYTQMKSELQAVQQHFLDEDLHNFVLSLLTNYFLFIRQGLYSEGADLLTLAEDLSHSLKMPVVMCHVALTQAFRRRSEGDFLHAKHYLEAALEQAESISHGYYGVLGLLEKAYLEYETGDRTGCEKTLLILKEKATQFHIKSVEADIQLLEANITLSSGRLEEAKSLYIQTQTLYRTLGNSLGEHVCLMNEGIAMSQMGISSNALQLLHEAQVFFKTHEIYSYLPLVYINLGKIFASLGYIEPAIDHFGAAAKLLRVLGSTPRELRPMIYAYGLTGRDPGYFRFAYQGLEEVQRLAKLNDLMPEIALCTLYLAELDARHSQVSRAALRYRQSAQLFQQQGDMERFQLALLGLAEAHIKSCEYQNAANLLLEIEGQRHFASVQWRLHAIRGKLYEVHSDKINAFEEYKKSLSAIQHLRRHASSEIDSAQLAFEFRQLREEAIQAALVTENSENLATISELAGTQKIGPVWKAEHTVQMEDLRGDLSQQHGIDWTIVRYVQHGAMLYLIMVTPDTCEVTPVTVDPPFGFALNALTAPADSFRRFAYASSASERLRQRLYNQLIPESVRLRLHKEHTLYIIPSGRLCLVAFQALLDEFHEPLIMKTRVKLAWSFRELIQDSKSIPIYTDMSYLAISQSEFVDDNLPDLKWAEADAISIAQAGKQVTHLRLAPTNNEIDVWVEAIAKHDVIHLVTHAHMNKFTGSSDGLILGNQILREEMIRSLNLKAKLVTLSACRTGTEKWLHGDEVLGLAQAFLSAGAECVVACLWQATDKQTAQLMKDFYSHWETSRSAVKALAEAQRKAYLTDMPAYYWSPFFVIGETL